MKINKKNTSVTGHVLVNEEVMLGLKASYIGNLLPPMSTDLQMIYGKCRFLVISFARMTGGLINFGRCCAYSAKPDGASRNEKECVRERE